MLSCGRQGHVLHLLNLQHHGAFNLQVRKTGKLGSECNKMHATPLNTVMSLSIYTVVATPKEGDRRMQETHYCPVPW